MYKFYTHKIITHLFVAYLFLMGVCRQDILLLTKLIKG